MKISLRKANAVQNSIQEVLRGIELQPMVSITEFEDANQAISAQKAKFNQAVSRVTELTYALYEIRAAVGESNRAAGIDKYLTEIAFLDRQAAFFSGLAGNAAKLADEVIAGQLHKIRARAEDANSYYRQSTVETSVLTAEEVASFRERELACKRNKQKLQDQVLEKNVRTEIELGENVEKVLRDEGLL